MAVNSLQAESSLQTQWKILIWNEKEFHFNLFYLLGLVMPFGHCPSGMFLEENCGHYCVIQLDDWFVEFFSMYTIGHWVLVFFFF